MVFQVLRYAVKFTAFLVFIRLLITLLKHLFVLIKHNLISKYKLSKNNKPK